ncbi:extracellular solute-binding protein [Umboniibacter marinipuniceus]|uniref:Putrescine-binding periplasmic protein n=1 Tax=Umboniibacter marinipuniceus TaxID=569599 RepID=A0A3M0ACS8_9GAMM|nr:extracellular solute-binding protein [Umboniibacter marinipuniceus]RMA80275.1 putrescine transport system substrate-binding protein [Umboniibacter marinipuniceus]
MRFKVKLGGFALLALIPSLSLSETLRVFNWSDYVAEDTIAQFEAKTGVTVVYDEYESNERLDRELRSGTDVWDVVFPSDNFFVSQLRDGLYTPLSKRNIPNYYTNLDRSFLARMQTDIDPGNRFGLPYLWGTTGIAIDKAKIAEVMGADFTFTSWAQLFDPMNLRKLQRCGVNFFDSPDEMLPLAFLALGKSPNANSPADIQEAVNLIKRASNYVEFSMEDFEVGLTSGETCLTVAWNGDVIAAFDEVDNADNYAYIIPEEGSILWIDMVAIPANAANPERAHEFINFLLDAEVNAAIVNEIAYPSAVRAAEAFVDPEVQTNEGIYPPDSVRARLIIPAADSDEITQLKLRGWLSIRGADWSAE